jgi:hypothetical protein
MISDDKHGAHNLLDLPDPTFRTDIAPVITIEYIKDL